jgi:hypothetical protein
VRRTAQVVYCRGPLVAAANLALGLVDLIAEGAGLLLAGPVRVGDELALRLDAPGPGGPLERTAAVAWVVPAAGGLTCAGVRFDRPLAAADLARLTRP